MTSQTAMDSLAPQPKTNPSALGLTLSQAKTFLPSGEATFPERTQFIRGQMQTTFPEKR